MTDYWAVRLTRAFGANVNESNNLSGLASKNVG
jgi:hypothetical protein